MKSQVVVQSWLCPVTPKPLLLASPLPVKNFSVLYSILEGLCRAVVHAKGRLTPIHDSGIHLQPDISQQKLAITPAANYVIVATAFSGLLNWPNGFYQFLDAYRHRSGRKPTGNIQADFAVLYRAFLEKRWSHRDFDFVQQAFEDFVRNNYKLSFSLIHTRRYQENEKFRKSFATITLTDAARKLQVSPETVKKLIDERKLTRLQPVGKHGRGSILLVLRIEVEELYERWSSGVSLSQTAVTLGISEDIVVGLAQLKLIETLRSPTDDSAAQWLFGGQSITNLLDALRLKNQMEVAQAEWLSLTQATQQLAIYGYNAAQMIHAVLQGEVAARWGGRLLHQLELASESVQQLRERLRQGRAMLSRQQVAEMASAKPETVQKWIDLGLIQTKADVEGGVWIAAVEWQHFQSAYAGSDEASEILGIGLLTVQKWARKGRLRPVCGGEGSDLHSYLFLRADLHRLARPNRMTAPELAAELGLSRSQLSEWIRSAKVHAVSGPGIDGMGQYLFLRDHVRRPETQ